MNEEVDSWESLPLWKGERGKEMDVLRSLGAASALSLLRVQELGLAKVPSRPMRLLRA